MFLDPLKNVKGILQPWADLSKYRMVLKLETRNSASASAKWQIPRNFDGAKIYQTMIIPNYTIQLCQTLPIFFKYIDRVWLKHPHKILQVNTLLYVFIQFSLKREK